MQVIGAVGVNVTGGRQGRIPAVLPLFRPI
jgi:hypothetical protein